MARSLRQRAVPQPAVLIHKINGTGDRITVVGQFVCLGNAVGGLGGTLAERCD